MKKITRRLVLLLALFIILIISTVAAYLAREDLCAALHSLRELGYFGIFLLSFLGAASIFIPLPYTVVLLTVSASGQFNPFLLATVAGIGAGVGELVGYGLGYFGRRYVDKKYGRRFNAIVKLLDYRYYGPIAVFIFALLPLPDDLLFIPLGLLRYNLWKVFVPCMLGKFLMSFIIVYVGQEIGQSIIEGSPMFAIIMVVLLILILIAMFKIDWGKLVKRYVPKETKKRVRR
jgi:membrane protein YqaA with SNARE-associated domain